MALLLAAAFPAASIPWRFQIDRTSGDPVVLLDRGTPAATLRWADEELVATVNVLSALVTAPTSLAHLLEATGAPRF